MKKETITFLQAYTEVHSDIMVDIQGSERVWESDNDKVRIYNRKVLLRSEGVNNMVVQRKRELFNQLKKKGITNFAIIGGEDY